MYKNDNIYQLDISFVISGGFYDLIKRQKHTIL